MRHHHHHVTKDVRMHNPKAAGEHHSVSPPDKPSHNHHHHEQQMKDMTICDGCNRQNIDSFYYQCEHCQDYELCYKCRSRSVTTKFHTNTHRMIFLSDKIMPSIDINELEFKRELGRGAFGIAYKAYWPSRNRTVACKVITVPVDIFTNDKEKSFFKEISAYSQISGHYILKTYGYSQKILENGNREYVLVMEYMDKGSLTSLIHEKKEKLTFRKKLLIACNIASGMRKIHDHQMIHRDIRPDNILIKQGYTAKIGDMGIARIMSRSKQHTVIGYEPYMPLEFYTGIYDQKLDIFTFGLTLNELFTEILHDKHPNKRVIITKQSPVFWDLISNCIHDDPQRRPTALEVEIKLYKFKDSLTEMIKRTKDYNIFSHDKKNHFFVNYYEQRHL